MLAAPQRRAARPTILIATDRNRHASVTMVPVRFRCAVKMQTHDVMVVRRTHHAEQCAQRLTAQLASMPPDPLDPTLRDRCVANNETRVHASAQTSDDLTDLLRLVVPENAAPLRDAVRSVTTLPTVPTTASALMRRAGPTSTSAGRSKKRVHARHGLCVRALRMSRLGIRVQLVAECVWPRLARAPNRVALRR